MELTAEAKEFERVTSESNESANELNLVGSN
jgi:hypothetical protein